MTTSAVITRLDDLGYTWRDPDPVRSEAIRRVLNPWLGTPYRKNWQDKGRGVDCVRFLAAVVDEVRGTKTPTEYLPHDAFLHNRDTGIGAMRRLHRLWQPMSQLGEGRQVLEPMDLVVVGALGPGHGMLVGPDRNTLWESYGSNRSGGVRVTGWSLPPRLQLFTVFRLGDREDWFKCS